MTTSKNITIIVGLSESNGNGRSCKPLRSVLINSFVQVEEQVKKATKELIMADTASAQWN